MVDWLVFYLRAKALAVCILAALYAALLLLDYAAFLVAVAALTAILARYLEGTRRW